MATVKTDLIFSSESDEWETPKDLFDSLEKEVPFGIFNLDPCCTEANKKAKFYYDKAANWLMCTWFGNVWCNPPYGKQIGKWVKKAVDEVELGNADCVYLLIPARTDTQYFHDYLYKKHNVEIRFIKGRLKFNGHVHNAPFPSMLAIIRPF